MPRVLEAVSQKPKSRCLFLVINHSKIYEIRCYPVNISIGYNIRAN